jgi:23S rRNA (adenine2503-C2)-methyltransferase
MSDGDRVNLLGLERGGLERFFAEQGEKPFRGRQVLQWIHRHRVANFCDMTDLGKSLRVRLAELAEVRAPEVVYQQASEDGTCKWLMRVDSGNCVESVLIPEPDRNTLCISSQVGCALDCTFCATAQQGFNRNLTSAEILGQLWLAKRLRPDLEISNVVFMGMGEPLVNFDNVVRAIDIMLDDCAYGLSKRRITLSTSGVVPALYRLRDVCDVSLAVSLHAATDPVRDQLVPLNRKYPIRELLAACRHYLEGQTARRRITWEYVMIDGLNDSDEQARQLVRLLRDIPSKVNLIPFNTFPGTHFRRSPQQRIDRFREILLQAGLTTITRRPRGEDIDAACGQLAGRVQDRTRRPLRAQTRTLVS